ncbi:cell division protein FtsX [Roseovarius sp. MBR-51]
MIPLLQVQFWNVLAQPTSWFALLFFFAHGAARPLKTGLGLIAAVAALLFVGSAVGMWTGILDTKIPARAGDFGFAFFQSLLFSAAHGLTIIMAASIGYTARLVVLRHRNEKEAF